MFKKIAFAAALAAVSASPAFAVTDAGFETGTSGWITLPTPDGALLSAVDSGTTLHTINDETGTPFSYAHDDGVPGTGVLAADGSKFGLLEICAASTVTCGSNSAYTLNLAGPVSKYGDVLWLRLMTEDYTAGALYNDSIKVSYYGAGSTSALGTDAISVASMLSAPIPLYYDSGWKGFAVPVGTQNMLITLTNADPYNRPLGLIDYTAAPVPEADSIAMMLAGLGVLGFVSRRRQVRG